jgi:hypothetical protein
MAMMTMVTINSTSVNADRCLRRLLIDGVRMVDRNLFALFQAVKK